MAQVSKNKSGGVIRWDSSDWLTGLIPQWNTSGYTDISAPKGLSFSRAIDPHREPGYLIPGATATDVTNASVIDALIKNGVGNGAKAYLIEGGAKLHELTVATNTLTTPTTFPHTISAHGGHTTVVGEDVAVYNVGTTKYLFYSWNDGTDGDVGRYDLSTTFDDDYLSTTAASGAVLATTNPHPMVVGDDDILYVADGNNLSAFDGQTGANGTWSTNVLTLPKDYIITSFSKTSTHLIIYAYKDKIGSSTFNRSEATAFFWDYNKDDPDYVYELDGNYVNGGFSFRGTPGCFVQGRSVSNLVSKTSKMLLFNGSGFTTITTFPQDIPGHGGILEQGNGLYWNSSGTIYRYGSPYDGFPDALNRITDLNNASTDRGILANYIANTFLASAGTGTGGGLMTVSAGYSPNALFYTPLHEISFPMGYKGRVNMVKVYYGAATQANSNTFDLFLATDRGATNTQITNVEQSITASTLIKKYYYANSGAGLPSFESIGLIGQWQGGSDATKIPPYLQAVEVYYTLEQS